MPGDEGAIWRRGEGATMSEDQLTDHVVRTLTKIYTRPSIGFHVCALDKHVDGGLHTILGRRFFATAPLEGQDNGEVRDVAWDEELEVEEEEEEEEHKSATESQPLSEGEEEEEEEGQEEDEESEYEVTDEEADEEEEEEEQAQEENEESEYEAADDDLSDLTDLDDLDFSNSDDFFSS